MILKLLKKLLKLNSKFKQYIYTKIVKLQCKTYGSDLTVNGKSRVTKNTIIRNNVNLNGMTIKENAQVDIGNNFHSGEMCLMITDIHNYDTGKAIPYDSSYIKKDIIIEDNVWLGDRVIVLGGVTVGEGSIIQAGSVLVKSIPKYAIAGGHPAKVFKYRDIEHYEQLKKEKRFH